MKILKKSVRMLKIFSYGFIGHLLIKPVSKFLGKIIKKDTIIFIGRDEGAFLDNVKYLFLHFYKNKEKLNGNKLFFLTQDKNVCEKLKQVSLPCIYYPSLKAIFLIIKTKVLIVDNLQWIYKFKVFLLSSSKKIQIWHGAGLKKIELKNENEFKNISKRLKNLLVDRFPFYDVLISTSEFFTKNFFEGAIKYSQVWETGYPRNDIFFKKETDLDFLFTDEKVIQYVRDQKKRGFKIILYVPTFRDTGGDAFSDRVLDIDKILSFLKKNKFILIVKFHPSPGFDYSKLKSNENFLFYENNKDIYPLLKDVDCLITDYSSIYIDFLLLNKPIIFFPYDYKKYITKDRKLQFDYNWITPGIKVYNQDELLTALENILIKKQDFYQDARKEILNIAFKYKDGLSSDRILENTKKILSSED